MKTLTADEFEQWVERDPAWAFKLTEPVEIADTCHLYESPITHLSPFLHFTGRSIRGTAALFQKCRALKVAEGTFLGSVYFLESGIERVGELVVTQPDTVGAKAYFLGCSKLYDPQAWLLGDDIMIDDELQARVWQGIFKRAVQKSLSQMPTMEI